MSNRLVDVQQFGQSIWYDNIRRSLITSGELLEMINGDGLRGITSNPSIFEKAIAGSEDYDPALKALVAQGVGTSKEIYERLAIEDIQWAADVLRPVYLRTNRLDGYVSLEVSPYLADDTAGTIEEAIRLRKAVGRENVMIKVPGTAAGFPAIAKLIGMGINVNVTLLFAVDQYEKAADAYITGLETFLASGGDLSKVASVASFFISRIDSRVDEQIGKALDGATDAGRRDKLKGLVGKIAIANAKVAYAKSLQIQATDRWKKLSAAGARTQRLLWASTSTKNPKYSKVMYVQELIGADTVNTVPAETFDAYRTEGAPRATLTENWDSNLAGAQTIVATLGDMGVSLKDATDFLLQDGVKKFAEAFDKLLEAVEKKRQSLLGGELSRQTYAVGAVADAVAATLADWRVTGKTRRMWAGDVSLWTGADESKWLGWMHVVEGQADHLDLFQEIADDVQAAGFTHVMLLGMGGSSLCPDVLRKTFGVIPGFPELHVLDSTVPAQVGSFEKRIDLAKTLFIVSSKSGTTSEPNAFKQFFMERVKQTIGADQAGSRFIAITDPGTKMHDIAKHDGFRRIAHGVPSIGGRYSALSNFGIVPAAAMGLDVRAFLESSEIMVHSCASCVPAELNPGVALGVALGELAKTGRDKVTIIASPGIGSLGAWLEQLIAESTGKHGKGLIPVADESLGAPAVYGADRVFAYIRLASAPDAAQDAAIDALEKAGQPVVRISLERTLDIGQEFFRWEIATAVAGAVIGINPFDQPDVEASKIATRRLSEAYEKTGQLPRETPIVSDAALKLFTDDRNADALAKSASAKSPAEFIAAHLDRLKAGDYFAINAYVEMNDANVAALQAIRHLVRDQKKVATTVGFGPRFLHSTGQLHKGGPNAGVFLQITSDDAHDLPIPGQKYTFGMLKQFQAQGDFEVLAERQRRALRVHLGADVAGGIAKLKEAVAAALR